MPETTSNKTIAKNTIMLYFRMGFGMIVGFFTSRVILQTLGVTDYGIYQTVGGLVGFISFLNNALSTGSSRFLTYELGRNNKEKLDKTFSTTLIIHLALALFIVLLAETAGLWFLYNKLNIPTERFDAAVYCYHLSVFTVFVAIVQVPYNASIIAHERMNVYAYAGILEILLRLVIVYLLYIGNFDKLMLYATLSFLLTVGFQAFYMLYCTHNFEEVKLRFVYDKTILKEIGKFSGWSLFANFTIALSNQGILMLLNMFFSPAVVAARAISLQVNGYVQQFVGNFRTAVNPQITKRFAMGDFEGHKTLLIESTVFSFFMLYVIGLPVFVGAEPFLQLWLGIVPDYAVIFLQIVVIQNLFSVFDVSLYQALYAKGDLKLNALTSPTINLMAFVVTYVCFRLGANPVALSWAYLIVNIILGCVQKPYLLVRIVGYKWSDFIPMYKTCFKVVLLSVPIPVFYYIFFSHLTGILFLDFILTVGVAFLSAALTIWFVGLNGQMREKLLDLALRKIKIRK